MSTLFLYLLYELCRLINHLNRREQPDGSLAPKSPRPMNEALELAQKTQALEDEPELPENETNKPPNQENRQQRLRFVYRREFPHLPTFVLVLPKLIVIH